MENYVNQPKKHQSQVNLWWIRRDLQLEDNAALHNALRAENSVQPIFIFDSEILARFENKKDRRLSFIARALVNLNTELNKRGGGVLVLHGKPEQIMPKLAKALQGAAYAGEDYEPGTITRDKKVAEEIELNLFKQHVILSPEQVLKDDGTPFKVFTPFSKKWKLKVEPTDHMEYQIEDKDRYADFSAIKQIAQEENLKVITSDDAEKMLHEVGYELVEDKLWKPENGKEMLKSFVAGRISQYKEKRDFPAENYTSSLSPYLRFGLVTIRQAYNAALKARNNDTWINELIWREFYMMILYHYPNTANEEFVEKYRDLEWRYDEADLELWKQGKTGYPIVDAGMRQLLETGWMHNRVRMIVASFLTKDLQIDWRLGEEHFAQYLMDYEMASNVGGWQWASSTGTDAAPYFRVFNPTLQGARFDPQGEYIKKYIPELRSLPKAELHEPAPIMRPIEYPQQIVDHKAVKPKIMKMFKR